MTALDRTIIGSGVAGFAMLFALCGVAAAQKAAGDCEAEVGAALEASRKCG